MNTKFDVGLLYRDDIPAQEISNLVDELSAAGATVVTEERENAPFSSIEWAIPAAIIAYLAKPYIETILEEAAKEHYPIIKSSLSRFAHKFLNVKEKKYYSSQSPNKEQFGIKVSGTFAIWSTTTDGRPIKFLFYGEKDSDYYDICIERAFVKLAQHFQEFPNDTISIQASSLERKTREIYMLFNESRQEWVVVDMITEHPAQE